MTSTFTNHQSIRLSEAEFDETFPLLENHLNPSASWSSGGEHGCLFETYGEELAFVRQQDPRCVWTLLDDDDGNPLIASGFHYVNRVGYFVSAVPVPDDMDYFVPIEPVPGPEQRASEHEVRV
jgi:hypothetical protein